jgi:hypothetical protein
MRNKTERQYPHTLKSPNKKIDEKKEERKRVEYGRVIERK